MWITFSASVPESADSTSACTLDFERWGDHLEPSAWSRGKPLRSRAWVQRFKKGGWTKRLSGAVISEIFPEDPCLESIGFVGDTLASPSAPPESEGEETTPDTYGLSSSDLFGNSDPPACCLKTWPGIYRWGCSMSCPIWKAVVTERRGAVTRRRLSELHTDGNEYSSSGWPTPDCTMRPHEGNVRLLRKGVEQGMSKAEADAMLGRDIGKPQGKLAAWPTPDPDTDQHPIDGLHHQVWISQTKRRPVRLNPDWVEMLMGYPIGWTDCVPLETA